MVSSSPPLLMVMVTSRCSFTLAPASGYWEITCPAGTESSFDSTSLTRRFLSSSICCATTEDLPTTSGTSTSAELQNLPKDRKEPTKNPIINMPTSTAINFLDLKIGVSFSST